MSQAAIYALPTAATNTEKAIIDPTTTDFEGQTSSDESHGVTEPDAPSDESEYPPMGKVIVIMLALYLCIFLVALDRTIIATAIPRITDEFHDFGQVGWFGSAYLLTTCSFILLLGRVYTFYNTKWTFLTCIFLFEVGSAICGAAPNSVSFIVGRAVAGAGAAGIFSGGIIIMVQILPLEKRPVFQSFFGAIFGIASVVGPLLGGVFTTDVTWRWCFYLNLPIGAIAMATVFFLLHPKPIQTKLKTTREKIGALDLPGTSVFIPAIVCLLLALEWGGSTYAWSNWRVVLCLVLAGVLLVAFVGIQIWKGDKGTVPPRLITQRTVAAGISYAFFSGGAMMVIVYFLPVWFQAIQGVDAVESGIRNLPLVLSMVPAAIIAGAMVQKFGWYNPFMIASAILLPIGAGLLCTLTPTTGHAKWIGVQVLFGFALGLGMQQPNLAVQACLPKSDVPMAISIIFFGQTLGGAIFVSVAQNLLSTRLISGLAGIPGFDARSVVNIGATEIRNVVPVQFLARVVAAYNTAIVDVFYVGVGLSCCLIFGAVSMEWKNLKTSNNIKQKPAVGNEEKA